MRIESESLTQNDVVVHTGAMNLTRLQGFFNGTTANRWLQLHDAKSTPADTAVPLRVWPLYTTAPFDQNFQNDPIHLTTGCVLVVSSTQATLTTSADTMDLFVNGESVVDTTGVSTAGDYSTADEVLQVWADSAGPKTLLRLELTNYDGGSADYAQIHAGDTPATDKIVASVPAPAGGLSSNHDFGLGLIPKAVIDGVTYNGCTVAMSSERWTYEPLVAASYYIKATYQ